MALDNDNTMLLALWSKMEKSKCSVLCLYENCLSGYDLLSDLDQVRERGMGTCGAGRMRTEYKKKEGLGENMRAINTHLSKKQCHDESKKSRGRERLTGTDRQRVKVKMTERHVGGGTERRG